MSEAPAAEPLRVCVVDDDPFVTASLATILSAALMLRYSFSLSAAADCIEDAVDRVLASGLRTADLIGAGKETPLGCTAMTDAILAAI